MTTSPPSKLISVSTAAKIAAVSEVTIRRHIESGDIRAVRLGESGPIRVSTAALADWLKPHPASNRETFASDLAALEEQAVDAARTGSRDREPRR